MTTTEHPFQELIIMTREVYQRYQQDHTLPTILARLTELERNYEVLSKPEAKKLRTLAEPAFEYGVYLAPSPTDMENVIIGYRGVRMEVKYPETLEDKRERMSQGQELVLNSEQNILHIHENQLQPGEVAEVVNVLKPSGSGEVVDIFEDRQPLMLRVRWRESEETDVIASEALDPLRAYIRKGTIVQLNPEGTVAESLVRPTIHVRGGGSGGSVIEISEDLMREGVQIGNLVRYDPSLKFAFEKIVSNTSTKLSLEKIPDITYDDIGGLEQIVGKIRDAIELPYIHRAKYRRYAMTRPKGILLSGPPGCGKTLVAKAVANSLTHTIRQHMEERKQRLALYHDLTTNPNDPILAERYRALEGENAAYVNSDTAVRHLQDWFRQFDIDPRRAAEEINSINVRLNTEGAIRAYFLNVKGPELLSKWVGETERQIREIFDEARRTATFDSPVIIFFDEMESLFRTRGSGRSSDVETTIVPQFLSEIDGVEASENVIVMGATNRQDMIDPAFMRPGRFDYKFDIPRPNKRAAQEILALTLLPTLPIDESGTAGRPAAASNIVFRTAYRDAEEGSALAAIHTINADVRLLHSLSESDIALLRSQPPETTVRQAKARVGSESLILKLNRFRSTLLISDLLNAIDKVHRESQHDPSLTRQLNTLAQRESIADAMVTDAVDYIYADTSTILVQTVDMTFKPRLRDFVSGATLASVVERAKSLALKREIASGRPLARAFASRM